MHLFRQDKMSSIILQLLWFIHLQMSQCYATIACTSAHHSPYLHTPQFLTVWSFNHGDSVNAELLQISSSDRRMGVLSIIDDANKHTKVIKPLTPKQIFSSKSPFSKGVLSFFLVFKPLREVLKKKTKVWKNSIGEGGRRQKSILFYHALKLQFVCH